MRITLAAALLIVCAAVARADDCEDVGHLGAMLSHIDKQCTGWRLTEKGREVQIAMAARVVALGGESCIMRGRAEMLRDMPLYNPDLEALAKSGNQQRFTEGLCVAIAKYLSIVGTPASQSPLIERRNAGGRRTQASQPVCTTLDDLHRYMLAGLTNDRKAKWNCRLVPAGLRLRVVEIISRSQIGELARVLALNDNEQPVANGYTLLVDPPN
jgi:hypothetical protein